MIIKNFIFGIMGAVFCLVFFASGGAAHRAVSQNLVLYIPEDIFPLIKIETSNDKNKIFSVFELGSIKAAKQTGQNNGGAGWIFGVSKVSEDSLHKILQNDASGIELFACKDNDYYLYNHPTDVRYLRENNEAMHRDQAVWTKVNEWGFNEVRQKFIEDNNLRPITADNSDIGITLAKVMYDKNSNAYLTSFAAGKFKIDAREAEKYLKDLLYDAKFTMTDEKEPDGEYIVLDLLREKTTLRFYYASDKKNYVSRIVENNKPLVYKGECLYIKHPVTEVAKLYQSLADKANQPTIHGGDGFLGGWHESIAGRGRIDVKKIGDAYKIDIRWAESAMATAFWSMTAKFKNGALVYEDCEHKSITYNDKGVEKVVPHYKNGRGEFKILVSGELVWKDFTANAGNDSVFLKD